MAKEKVYPAGSISVEEGDGDETSDTGKALATLLATGGLLLTAGVLHGKRKGES